MQVMTFAARGFLFCAAAVQIVFGMLYIVGNYTAVPQFYETELYLQTAEQLVLDEQMGILYPLLIRLSQAVKIVPYQTVLYTIQLALGISSVYYAVYRWTGKKYKALLGTLWINTIPCVAQAHVTVLPHSLAAACMVFMCFHLLRASVLRRALKIAEWSVILGGFLLLAQLDTVYLLPGILFVIWAVVLQGCQQSHRMLLCGVSILIGIGMLIVNLSIYHVVQTPAAFGRMQHSFASVFFQRLGVQTMKEKYQPQMPEELQQDFTGKELECFGNYPYLIEEQFAPALLERYGEARTKEIYYALGTLGFSEATKANLVAICEDMFYYAVPMSSYIAASKGAQTGMMSWNYQQFIRQTPLLAVMYIRISSVLWSVLFAAGVLLFVCRAVWQKRVQPAKWLPAVLCVLVYAAFFALRGTELYDYKLALFPAIIGYVPIVYWAVRA